MAAILEGPICYGMSYFESWVTDLLGDTLHFSSHEYLSLLRKSLMNS